MLIYPFAVYRHIEDVSPRWFAGVFLVTFLLRFFFIGKSKRSTDWVMLAVVCVFCAIVMILESEQLLKFYPVLMNVGIGLLFIVSLADEQSLIERFANISGKTPPEAKGYLRTLTLLWGILLLFNGAVSAYTAWYTGLSIWALYNGFLSYLLIASFAAAEWVYRGYYKKKHNIIDE